MDIVVVKEIGYFGRDKVSFGLNILVSVLGAASQKGRTAVSQCTYSTTRERSNQGQICLENILEYIVFFCVYDGVLIYMVLPGT